MGGKSTTSTQSVSIPPEVLARYNAVNARAESVAQQPFQQYPGQFVASLTPTQQAGVQATSQYSQAAQPYYGAATGLTLAGAQPITPQGLDVGRYMSPYTGYVAGATEAALRQQQGQQLSQQQAEAIKSGAFGGDRAGIQRAVLQGQQGLATAQALAPIYQQGFGQALQTAQQQQGVQLGAEQANRQALQQAAQQIAGLGTGAQQAALQGAQAQIGAGTLEQQTQQADLTARYQQFLQERGYPFQVAQFLANIAMGTGALSGSTTTTTQPAGFFSDERLKDNIEPIGKTFDGQPIYRYDYGDGRTQIGLIAQDVLARGKPGVGRDKSGYLTVDYRDATDDAAAMASAGGVVDEPGAYERGGYIGGGLVGSDDLKSILASQQQSFGPFGQSGLYGGQGAGAGAPGAAGIVPSAKLPVPKLATPTSSVSSQPSGMSQAISTGKGLADLYQAGKGLKAEFMPSDEQKAQKLKDAEALKPYLEKVRQGNASGGLVPRGGYAEGGTPEDQDDGSMPYGNDAAGGNQDILGNVVKSGSQHIQSLKTPGAPAPGGGQQSGLGQAATLLGSGTSALKGLSSLKEGFSGLGSALGLGEGAAGAAGAAGGIGSALGSIGSGFAQVAPFLLSIFSDARLKHNIEPVGKTFDGQNIYRYDMGDGKTHIGLMAQEVLRHHPDAVGERDGYLTVDYGRATEDASPFAYGGLVPRQAHAAGETVIPDYSEEADLPAIGAVETSADQPGLVPRKYKIDPQKKEEMEPHWQDFINYIYPREGGLDAEGKPKYNVRQGTGKETFDIEAGHPGLAPAPGGKSSAAGAGQFINATWNRVTGGAPMTEGYQDAAMKALAIDDYKRRTGRDLDTDLREKGLTTEIKSALKPTWAGIDAPMPPGLIGRGDADLPARGVQEAQYRNQEPGLIDSLGEKLTSERYMVPALSFLGSMLASNKPFLGQAIGEGLVGGVHGYQTMQKQQMEMAKNLIDVIGNRFERTIENGQVVYRNKLTDEKVPPGQMQATIYQMFKKAGLNPEQYGISPPSGPVRPASTETKLTAAGGDPSVGSVTTTGKMPNISTAEVGGAEKPPGTEGKKPIPAKDVSDMDALELRRYYEEHGVWNPGDDPRNIRSQINTLMQKEKEASAIGGKEFLDQAAKYREERRALETRLDSLLDKAVSTQLAANAEVQKGRAGQAINLEEKIGARQESRAQALSNWNRFAQIIADKDTGRLQPAIAGLTSVIKDLGLKVDPKDLSDAAKFDVALKLSMKEVYDSMARENLVRAPAASQKGLSMTVPGPQMITGAPYEILGRIIGELNYMRDRDNAYLDQQGAGKEISPARFYRKYDAANGEKALNKHIAQAFNELPANEKIPREFFDSMYRSYGKHGYVPPGAREAAPAAGSTVPQPLQDVEGLVYSPSRKQYRDAQGNIYDATGKRVQ